MADEVKAVAEPPKVNGAEWPMIVSLRKPVMVGDEEIKELRLREPTPADLEQIGDPVDVDFFSSETPKMTYNWRAMTPMIARLAAVPPSTIRKVDIRELKGVALRLANFFLPDLQ